MALDTFRSTKAYIPILIILQFAVVFSIYSANQKLQVYIRSDNFARLLFNIPERHHSMCKTKHGERVEIKILDNAHTENANNIAFTNDSGADGFEPELCPLFGKYQGKVFVDLETEPDCLEDIMKDNPLVQNGGSYSPECKARRKAAIVIPFRKRDQHLLYFLQYMHPILQRQQIEYKIFVINQDGDETFNKDKLMNIGFIEALKEDFHCFIFHDVDLILTNDRCIYQCQSQPVHFAHNVDKFNGLPYHSYFGGAIGLSGSQFLRINGFPNSFLGWGGEDDVILKRIQATGMTFVRYDKNIAKYKMVRHIHDVGNERNRDAQMLLRYAKATYTRDGLNTLPSTYEILDRFEHPLFTMITVDVNYHENHVKRRSIIK